MIIFSWNAGKKAQHIFLIYWYTYSVMSWATQCAFQEYNIYLMFKLLFFLDLRQVYNSDTAKLFQLLQQCQERALTIVSTLGM